MGKNKDRKTEEKGQKIVEKHGGKNHGDFIFK